MPTIASDQLIDYLNAPLEFEPRDDDLSTVKFVNEIIHKAIQQRVSDIHFEPFAQEYRIRYRIDGLLTEIASPPLNSANRISSYLKVMANLDIAERRKPQDGCLQFKQSPTEGIDVRISTCPTLYGEKIVLRILDTQLISLAIDDLGLNAHQKKYFLSNLSKPQGMILVTGPTGSGKTVTLYTALNYLNRIEKNISTVEDPVEIKIHGINQVNINSKAGLSFSAILRSFLRQDPDILMIGEIRDFETAELAVKAAHTGHLVLSTLHTNNSAETLVRLLDLGIPAFNITNSINLIIAQRLARRLCEQCKIIREDLNLEEILKLGLPEKEAKEAKLYKAQGCNQCIKGYRGRLGLFEVMPISATLRQQFSTEYKDFEIFKLAQKEGMISIYQSGIEKVKQGLTTVEEINRVAVA